MATATCRYRNALGAPGTGLHSFRVFGLAAFDVLATLVAAMVIATALAACAGSKPSLWLDAGVFAALVCAGAFVHHMLCIKTPLNAWLSSRGGAKDAVARTELRG